MVAFHLPRETSSISITMTEGAPVSSSRITRFTDESRYWSSISPPSLNPVLTRELVDQVQSTNRRPSIPCRWMRTLAATGY